MVVGAFLREVCERECEWTDLLRSKARRAVSKRGHDTRGCSLAVTPTGPPRQHNTQCDTRHYTTHKRTHTAVARAHACTRQRQTLLVHAAAIDTDTINPQPLNSINVRPPLCLCTALIQHYALQRYSTAHTVTQCTVCTQPRARRTDPDTDRSTQSAPTIKAAPTKAAKNGNLGVGRQQGAVNSA
eukprot:scaffold9643_cov144-Isochrysis_galbana.AAC.1